MMTIKKTAYREAIAADLKPLDVFRFDRQFGGEIDVFLFTGSVVFKCRSMRSVNMMTGTIYNVARDAKVRIFDRLTLEYERGQG